MVPHQHEDPNEKKKNCDALSLGFVFFILFMISTYLKGQYLNQGYVAAFSSAFVLGLFILYSNYIERSLFGFAFCLSMSVLLPFINNFRLVETEEKCEVLGLYSSISTGKKRGSTEPGKQILQVKCSDSVKKVLAELVEDLPISTGENLKIRRGLFGFKKL